MAKYKKEFTALILQWIEKNGLIDYGGAMLKDFLAEFGIDPKTYYHWLNKEEFKKGVDAAKDVFKKQLTHDLTISLAKVAMGYSAEEKEVEYRPNPTNSQQPTIARMKTRHVNYQPNVGAAIFLLTNLAPEHYQNRQHNDIAVKDDENKQMSVEEIDKEIARLSKLDNKE